VHRVTTDLIAAQAHLVRVTTDDRDRRIWIAATPRSEAVTAVLNAVPEGWAASLFSNKLRAVEIAALNLKPGEVREFHPMRSAPKPKVN
jgi:hypothetical protein